jgi:molybdopterin-synthase adenylyltransferase
MPLAESELLRYSRQILVPEIGGLGQERLRAWSVMLVGKGTAQEVAARYLAAGGTEVRTELEPFEVGGTEADRWRLVGAGSLGEVPAHFSGRGPWVGLGWTGARGELIYRSAAGCTRCFEGNLRLLSSAPPRGQPTLLGTMAALVFQRICLGLSSHLGRLAVDPGGEISSLDARRCVQCA